MLSYTKRWQCYYVDAYKIHEIHKELKKVKHYTWRWYTVWICKKPSVHKKCSALQPYKTTKHSITLDRMDIFSEKYNNYLKTRLYLVNNQYLLLNPLTWKIILKAWTLKVWNTCYHFIIYKKKNNNNCMKLG